jgi:hypothetical protein
MPKQFSRIGTPAPSMNYHHLRALGPCPPRKESSPPPPRRLNARLGPRMAFGTHVHMLTKGPCSGRTALQLAQVMMANPVWISTSVTGLPWPREIFQL